MANETTTDEREAAIKAEREAYEKLSPEEKKKYREGEEKLQSRMDKTNYF